MKILRLRNLTFFGALSLFSGASSVYAIAFHVCTEEYQTASSAMTALGTHLATTTAKVSEWIEACGVDEDCQAKVTVAENALVELASLLPNRLNLYQPSYNLYRSFRLKVVNLKLGELPAEVRGLVVAEGIYNFYDSYSKAGDQLSAYQQVSLDFTNALTAVRLSPILVEINVPEALSTILTETGAAQALAAQSFGCNARGYTNITAMGLGGGGLNGLGNFGPFQFQNTHVISPPLTPTFIMPDMTVDFTTGSLSDVRWETISNGLWQAYRKLQFTISVPPGLTTGDAIYNYDGSVLVPANTDICASMSPLFPGSGVSVGDWDLIEYNAAHNCVEVYSHFIAALTSTGSDSDPFGKLYTLCLDPEGNSDPGGVRTGQTESCTMTWKTDGPPGGAPHNVNFEWYPNASSGIQTHQNFTVVLPTDNPPENSGYEWDPGSGGWYVPNANAKKSSKH